MIVLYDLDAHMLDGLGRIGICCASRCTFDVHRVIVRTSAMIAPKVFWVVSANVMKWQRPTISGDVSCHNVDPHVCEYHMRE